MAKSKFGSVWLPNLARPSLAKTKFGQVWPNVDRNIFESQLTKMPKMRENKREMKKRENKQCPERGKISLPQEKEHENAKWRGG